LTFADKQLSKLKQCFVISLSIIASTMGFVEKRSNKCQKLVQEVNLAAAFFALHPNLTTPLSGRHVIFSQRQNHSSF